MTNEERVKEIIHQVLTPLYPPEMSIEHMPAYEQGMYRQWIAPITAALDEKDKLLWTAAKELATVCAERDELRKRVAELENEMTHLAQQRFGNI